MDSNLYPEHYDLNHWLPTTAKEVKARGWDDLDVIIFSGDAYIDHPAFGAAVIGRILEKLHLKVAIVPQPNWKDDLRDFKKLGAPRLFFGITAGNMDSMVNHYTAGKRLRSDDPYTPGARPGHRPDRAVSVYASILRKIYPDSLIIAGGIEASLRRLAHYDYWNDELMPGLPAQRLIDLILYGNAEPALKELVETLKSGGPIKTIHEIPQTAFFAENYQNLLTKSNLHILNSFEECMSNHRLFAENFKLIEQESNKLKGYTLIEPYGKSAIVVNPPFEPMTTNDLDDVYGLPFTRLPHPRYWQKPPIPAYEMIRFSITMHRGCFGGCSFCTISMHQGKHVSSRSEKSIVDEAVKISRMPGFKGYISDLGGPSANMYRLEPKNSTLCRQCKKPSCIHPSVCKNLNTNHQPLIDLYRKVRNLPGIKKVFVSSGVRYDLFTLDELAPDKDKKLYAEELIAHHISGRIKVAPEHTRQHVLSLVRKPDFEQFYRFKTIFDQTNIKYQLKQQIIPYFISGLPGCHELDMAELAAETRRLNLKHEQIQDFTPTPMTLASVIFFTGIDPYTDKQVYAARSAEEKKLQRAYFFSHKPNERKIILERLKKLKRPDLIKRIL